MRTRQSIGRRRVLGSSLALAALGSSGSAWASPLDQLATAARTEGPVVWYQTAPLDQIEPFVRAFEKRFPGVRLRPIRLVGGSEMGSRIVQEIQAGAPTADVGTGGRDSVSELAKRGLIGSADWAALGVPRELIIGGNQVAIAAGLFLIVINTKLVPDLEALRNWDDLLDPRWSGQLALWASAGAFANLAKSWGEARATRYVERIAAQKPLLFRSMYNLAQAVAAGEAAVGVGTYMTTAPAVRAGAPLRIELGNPVSVSTLTSFLVATSRNPNGSRLLLAWCASAEGASAYEDATGVGVHLVHPTRTAELIGNREVSEFGPDEQDALIALRHRYNQMLQSAGRDLR